MIDISALGFEDLETCIVQKLEISIKPNTTPIYLPPYRKSSAEREIIKQEVQKMLDAKVIEPCMSAWSSPCIMIPKKNGKKRFCVDYRQLNAVTIPTYWPIPLLTGFLLTTACSKLDIMLRVLFAGTIKGSSHVNNASTGRCSLSMDFMNHMRSPTSNYSLSYS